MDVGSDDESGFDLNSGIPIPSNWFSAVIDYKGRGHAEFSDPKGIIEGPTHAEFNEFGEYTIQMDATGVYFDPISTNSIFDILKIGGLEHNPCIKLEVKTPKGTFVASAKLNYSYKGNIFGSKGKKHGVILTFRQQGAIFNTPINTPPTYWVLPISNFLSDFMQQVPNLAHHPLRIYPSMKVPQGFSEKDADIAEFVANQKNRLIMFEFNGSQGFIEPLADYEDRKQKLITGRVRNTITAIMVGATAGKPTKNYNEIETWFPIDYLRILGLATGSEIGAPWIEFRDKKGRLVRRIHIDLGNPTFLKGHRSIDEVFHRGTGRLLSQATLSPYWGTSELRVVMRHLVRGGFLQQTMLEDRFNYLCRGLETLCRHFNLKDQILTDSMSISERDVVINLLDDAAKKIRLLSECSPFRDDLDKVRKLRNIGDRVRNSAGKTKDFGLSVCDLLKLFSLPDAEILDAHYGAFPRTDGRQKWFEVLSYYRGSVVHEGYFDILGSKHDRDDILIIINHLHDILLRIVFRMLTYDGEYDPTVLPYTAKESIDWVTPATTAEKLGYK
ncbi:MAG: hypothetical protein A2W33_03950 [Chloroflexi bacterium RBG_16_52_11]|nr:MAG: hypothetical protein A2W33_03950 [Chloroflexi bacterium RBG_16_52_11]